MNERPYNYHDDAGWEAGQRKPDPEPRVAKIIHCLPSPLLNIELSYFECPIFYWALRDHERDHLGKGEPDINDIAEGYVVVKSDRASVGLIVYGLYRGKWVPNCKAEPVILWLLTDKKGYW
jgi:hypothetical protein